MEGSMSFKIIFTTRQFFDLTTNIISALLIDIDKTEISNKLKIEIKNIYKNTFDSCSLKIESDKKENLHNIFRNSEFQQKTLSFKYEKNIIPSSFFKDLFSIILEGNHANTFYEDFFSKFNKEIIKNDELISFIQINYGQQIYNFIENHPDQNFIKEKNTQQALKELLNEWENALQYSSTNIHHTILKAQALDNMGFIHQQNANWAEALDFYKKSLEGIKTINDISSMALINSNIGLMYEKLNDLENAIKYYNSALNNKEKSGDIQEMAIMYGNISILYFEQRKHSQAIIGIFGMLIFFAKIGVMNLVQKANSILSNFMQEIGEEKFSLLANESLNNLAQNGVVLGQTQVVSPEEADKIWKVLVGRDGQNESE